MPIRQDPELLEYNIILPHEPGCNNQNTREFYRSLDLIIAEVSYPGTGLGIELGWGFDDGIPIACIYKKEAKISGSLIAVSDRFYQYSTPKELINTIKTIIKEFTSHVH